MLFKRKIFDTILPWLSKDQIIVITGMRRTGKTVLVKQLAEKLETKNFLYLDLESLDNREIFNVKNYDSILTRLAQKGLDSKSPICLILDEIQLFPEIISRLKYLYDHYQIKFIVTGSSSYYLKNLFSESLAGRKIIFELQPLDFGEYLEFKEIPYKTNKKVDLSLGAVGYSELTSFYEEYIQFGGFPSVVLEPSAKIKKLLLDDIISSYINQDIRVLADFENLGKIQDTIKLLATRVGTRLDVSKLAGTVGVARSTMNGYLEFLEKTYILSLVPVFTGSQDKIVAKAKKIYFCDTGLANSLAQLSSGAQFENTIYGQLRHFGEVSYFTKRSGNEIDFILNKNIAFEAKETPNPADLKKLAKIAHQLGINQYAVIGRHKPANFEDFLWGGNLK